MQGGIENLAYAARGTRTYGLRPVLGRPRTYWEFQCIFQGEARPVHPDGEHKPGTPPCLYIAHPDSPHGWTDEGAKPSEVFVLHFRAIPTELSAQVAPAEILVVNLTETENRLLAVRLNEAWELKSAGDGRLALKLDQILIEVALLVLGRTTLAIAKNQPANRVEHALHWFEENLGENPSVDDVAQAVGLSSAHLRRLFAEAGRGSPRAEIARLRIAAAQRCLREGWKMERVALFLGLSDASAFSRAFSAFCGLSPRKWRSQEHKQ